MKTKKTHAMPTLRKPGVIAFDFDGTVVKHAFPEVGEDTGAVPVLRALHAAGHALILWTMRSDGQGRRPRALSEAVSWCYDNEITLYGVNENPRQRAWTGSPKCHADLYIDDAALGIPLIYPGGTERPYVDWFLTESLLTASGWLPLVPDANFANIPCPECGRVQEGVVRNAIGKSINGFTLPLTHGVWHREDFTPTMLTGGYRPLMLGERIREGDEVLRPAMDGRPAEGWTRHETDGTIARADHWFQRTKRPLPA